MSDVTEDPMAPDTDETAAIAATEVDTVVAGDTSPMLAGAPAPESEDTPDDAQDVLAGVSVLEPPAPDAPVLSVDDAAKLIEYGASVDEASTEATEAANAGDVESAPAPVWLAQALEALIFAAPEPLAASRLREVLADEGHEFPLLVVKRALQELVLKWASSEKSVGSGLRLMETGAGFAFRTSPESAQFLRRFFAAKPQRLSRAALETLAIIAYRQPVTRPQVDDIRGVDSAGALKNLLDRKLIRVLGKADDVGRPLIYGTTRAFLDFFSLQGLSDLPTLKDYQDLKGGAGVPEALPTPDDGPVKVMDLFDPLGSGDLVSKETEEESAKALSALENALGQATHVTARALAFEKGDVAAAEAIPPPARYTIEDDDEDRAAHDAGEGLVAEALPTDGVDETASSAAAGEPVADDAHVEVHDGAAAFDLARDAVGGPIGSETHNAPSADADDATHFADDDVAAEEHGHFRTRRSDEGSRFTPRTLLRDTAAAADAPETDDDAIADGERSNGDEEE
jgi:segregation and condensation protein B